jgi:hypothetical protein
VVVVVVDLAEDGVVLGEQGRAAEDQDCGEVAPPGDFAQSIQSMRLRFALRCVRY